MEKLKPCPFCGNEPTIRMFKGKDGWRDRYAVICRYDEGGCGAESGLYHYEKEAIEVWNRRAEPQWRPCSEPPEEDGVYIVYAPYYSGGSSSAKECHNGVMFSKYKNGKWSIEHGYYSRPNCVKAWKPLDKPCRGKGDQK